MRLLLDTHIWLWATSDRRQVKPEILQLIAEARLPVFISSMSLIEISQKVVHPRQPIVLNVPLADWFRAALPTGKLEVLSVTPEIAQRAYEWREEMHGDPADRVISATALVHGLSLITCDQKLITHPEVPTISAR